LVQKGERPPGREKEGEGRRAEEQPVVSINVPEADR